MTACRSNLKNIGTALDRYFAEHEEAYPPSLAALTPNYLRVIPACPAAGEDTYTGAYQGITGAYTVYCAGSSHYVGKDFPQYNSREGLVEVPARE